MNSPRTKLYRDKHNGKIMGVCAGVAEYTGIDAIWVRL
ncbi:MAG: PspC domain-containing protein, partial [Pseudomonadota bacterium]